MLTHGNFHIIPVGKTPPYLIFVKSLLSDILKRILTVNLIKPIIMRKIYLIVSGALLGLLPASSQTFERHPGLDAEVIFHQDFEVEEGLNEQQAYDRWAKTPIDTIRELEYYAKIGTSSVSSRTDIYAGSPDWEIFAVRRDSTSSAHTSGS